MKFIYVAGLCLSAFSILAAQSVDQDKTMKSTQEIIIGLAGDTMLGRLVNEVISEKGYSWPWGTMLSILQSTDINLVNLETTLTRHTLPVPKVFNFRADSDKVESLKKARIDVVNLANNHSLDFGDSGLIETMRVLNKAHIATVGAGADNEQAAKAAIIEKNGIKIGILGFTDNEPDWKAGPSKPGINYIEVGDIASVQQAVNNIRSYVDLIILSIHWGPNMLQQPTAEFQQFAHEIIESGVDIIHGHSAHILQGIEVYKNKLILYDTGDFVDDYAVDPQLRNDEGCFFMVTVQKNTLVQVQLIPTLIENMQVNKAKDPLASEILQRIGTLSEALGTNIDPNGIIKLNR